MKKIICALIALMLMAPAAALASDLEITQEAFYVTPFLTYYAGEIFCEVTNTSDRIIKITDGQYELLGEDGASLNSGSIYSIYPRTLGPGEKAYFSVTSSVKEADSADYIRSYKVSVVGKPVEEKEPEYEVSDVRMEEKSGIIRGTRLSATVTNDSEEPVPQLYLTFAVFDSDGALLYVGAASSMGLALLPGNSGQMGTDFDRDIMNALHEKGVEPASVVAIATGW